jgi:hypothetical protein
VRIISIRSLIPAEENASFCTSGTGGGIMLNNQNLPPVGHQAEGAHSQVDPDASNGCVERDSLGSSESPQLFGVLDLQSLYRPQGPNSGINAIIGAWPGDETDEEIFRMLEEMS